MGGLGYNNHYERDAAERGYVVMSTYDTKEEIDAILDQLHKCGVHAFKAHHAHRVIEYNQWWLWVQSKDFDKLAASGKAAY